MEWSTVGVSRNGQSEGFGGAFLRSRLNPSCSWTRMGLSQWQLPSAKGCRRRAIATLHASRHQFDLKRVTGLK